MRFKFRGSSHLNRYHQLIMTKKSAGILLYRIKNSQLECFLLHPGGPFFKNKDLGSWTIPKGEIDEHEDPLAAAVREFEEETGTRLDGEFVPLKPIKQKSGKLVYAWAVQGDIDASTIKCNTFEMEWPPKSGKFKSFPEVDRGEWFSIPNASTKILAAQQPLLQELVQLLKV
jgi:predicted NUDIX family NTP pyrophosphohydrolase